MVITYREVSNLAKGKREDLTPPKWAFVTCTFICGLARRFRMLGMRRKALDRALNLSQVAAQGDAALRAFFAALPLGPER